GAGNPADNALLTAGPVTIGGTAGFALTRRTVDVDTDGNGAPDLLDATLEAVALSVTGAYVDVAGVATLTVSGDLAIARVIPAGGVGGARYTALKMGAVTVAGNLAPGFD